ncbi:MAG: hypothetical protein ACO4AI_11830 [Prochlorothrix sp.]|nr:hypothetical protein [Prochlorothrix sp.]
MNPDPETVPTHGSDNTSHQIRHTLEQVLRFSQMLAGNLPADRSPAILYAQLGFNLGRYTELDPTLQPKAGRDLWRQYEACIQSQDWKPLHQWAREGLNALD